VLCHQLAASTLFAATLTIRVDPRVAFQTVDGFGASDAWQCAIVGRDWPEGKRQRIADLLFSRALDARGNPRGIGLSIWRFNVGAGTAEQGDASDIRNPWRRAECFQRADGSYDWSRQAGQRWFLEAAHRHGVGSLLAFSNSPPVHLTRNGKGYGARGLPGLNIKPGKLPAFGTFLADVVEHFERAGLHFDYLSPINEPQWAWDKPNQEGTPASNIEVYALARLLSRELSRRQLSTRIVIGEAGTIAHVSRKVEDDGRDDQARFFFDPDSAFYVGDLPSVAPLISAHGYHSVWPPEKQVQSRGMLHRALTSANPRLGYWQSEYCILEEPNAEVGGGPGRDLGMAVALYVARIIHDDLTVAQARSWQWWTAVSQVDYKDGLVYLDDGSAGDSGRMGPEAPSLMKDGAVRESKLLWTLGNYARFVRPGMVRVRCQVEPEQSIEDGVLGSAYKGTSGGLVVILVNLSRDDVACDLGAPGQVDVYTTSSRSDLERSRQDAAGIKLPARAVITCVLK
jgi:hypothetical protein